MVTVPQHWVRHQYIAGTGLTHSLHYYIISKQAAIGTVQVLWIWNLLTRSESGIIVLDPDPDLISLPKKIYIIFVNFSSECSNLSLITYIFPWIILEMRKKSRSSPTYSSQLFSWPGFLKGRIRIQNGLKSRIRIHTLVGTIRYMNSVIVRAVHTDPFGTFSNPSASLIGSAFKSFIIAGLESSLLIFNVIFK
jgi:hypothetical protein